MKIIQLNNDDIVNHELNGIRWHDFTQNVDLPQLVKFVNSILDYKYNKPLEQGKRQQKQNAYQLNSNRRMNTLSKLLKWYRKSELKLEVEEKITITKIAMDTRLHPNTVRNALIGYNEAYKLGHESNIAKNVMAILEKMAEMESV